MPVDGTIRRYINEPAHLLGMRENEPLHIPSVDDFFSSTGRVLIAADPNQFSDDTPFNLRDGPPGTALGTFQWSGLGIDGLLNVDIHDYFSLAQIANELPFNRWRVRCLWYSGYVNAFKTTPEPVVLSLNSMTVVGSGFNVVGTGWCLGPPPGSQNLINLIGGRYHFTGGPLGSPVDLWFPVQCQVEVGYGERSVFDLTANWQWPAFSGIKTDYKQYRGWSPTWACFNGFANAPNVVALGTCPNTGAGGYTPPPDPNP